jgi:hypothetical protein
VERRVRRRQLAAAVERLRGQAEHQGQQQVRVPRLERRARLRLERAVVVRQARRASLRRRIARPSVAA